MSFLMRLLVVVVAFCSLPVGLLLARLTSDEIISGKHYFFLLRNGALLALAFSLAYYSQTVLMFVASLVLAVFLLVTSSWTDSRREVIGYLFILAALLLTFTHEPNLTFLAASLTFIFGLASVAFLRG